jgi:hypothetical protein
MYAAGSKFPLSELGDVTMPDPLEKDISPRAWELVLNAPPLEEGPPEHIIALAEQRSAARADKNWPESDRLRDVLNAEGWTVQDGRDGYHLVKNEDVNK